MYVCMHVRPRFASVLVTLALDTDVDDFADPETGLELEQWELDPNDLKLVGRIAVR